MEVLWENKTGIQQITLRYLSHANQIGTSFRLFVSYLLNGKANTREVVPKYLIGLMPNCQDYTFECDAILSLTTEKMTATGSKYLAAAIFQVGIGIGNDFFLLDSICTCALNTEKGDLKGTKTVFVSDFENIAIAPGIMTVSGGTHAIFFGDILYSDYIKSISGVLTVSGATTGAKLILIKNYSSGFGEPVAIANYTTAGAEVIHFTLATDCVAEQRATNYLYAPMSKLYFYDLPSTRLIFQDPGGVSVLTSANCMAMYNQTLRVS